MDFHILIDDIFSVLTKDSTLTPIERKKVLSIVNDFHIVVESETEFSLWFGESKFYNSIEDARLSEIIESVKESLSLKKLKKENAIITSVSDINEFEKISKDLRNDYSSSFTERSC